MKIFAEGFSFYASENGNSKDKLLLQLDGYTENLGQVPIANEGGWSYASKSIFGILNIVAENPLCSLCVLEVIGKFIKMLVQKNMPYKILELGAGQGQLTYFLTQVAREFNEENMVHAVSNDLLSQEGLSLLLQYGDAINNLNLHITEPQTFALQESYFDFCVLNNLENFPNQEAVLNNAIRLLAPSGLLVFIAPDGKITEQKISLEQKMEAHRQTKEASVELQKAEMEILVQKMEKRLAEMENLTKEELGALIKDLIFLEKLAIKFLDLDLKNKLNAAKENALNFVFNKH